MWISRAASPLQCRGGHRRDREANKRWREFIPARGLSERSEGCWRAAAERDFDTGGLSLTETTPFYTAWSCDRKMQPLLAASRCLGYERMHNLAPELEKTLLDAMILRYDQGWS